MLVLKRKAGERIYIGKDHDIVVTVTEIRKGHGRSVRIGIQAPADVPILREELLRKIDAAHAADTV